MKALLITALLATACAATSSQEVQTQNTTNDADQRGWLLRLVGDWHATSEMAGEPGTEPITWECSESVRSIGNMWTVAEQDAATGDELFTSIMTLGYDPSQEAFVGTWIDSIQAKMWTYQGQLDAARNVLILEAEGPSHTDPSQMAKYQDRLELITPDHKRMSSYMLDEDGEWQQFLKVDYHRKQ